ncbi:MAG: hypothetical protein ABI977_13575 [Acidobacteriota bacterium]
MKLSRFFLVAGLLLVLSVVALAAGVDGKWTGQAQGPQGMMDVTFVFKADGEKLTGTYASTMGEAAISDGTIKGDALSFKVVREFNGNKFTLKYSGKLAGDEIKLTRTFEGEGPGGQAPPPVDFTVKRAAN